MTDPSEMFERQNTSTLETLRCRQPNGSRSALTDDATHASKRGPNKHHAE